MSAVTNSDSEGTRADQRSGRNLRRKEGAEEETHSLLADESSPKHVTEGEREGQGKGKSDNVPSSRSVRPVQRGKKKPTTVTMQQGEEEEAPPAYTSAITSPTHTLNSHGEGAPTEAGRVQDVVDDDQTDGLTNCLKTTLKLVRSIGGLIILLLAYTFFGAWIMMTIEGPAEVQEKQKVYNVRESIAEELKNNTEELRTGLLNTSEWEKRTDDLLLHLENTIHSSGVASTSKKKWTFFGAVLFCVTTYTTIGYGNIAPATKAGRIATMLYATVGIPLALLVLANLGRHFTVGLKFLWGFIRRYYYTGYCRRIRRRTDRRTYDMNEANVGLSGEDGGDLQHGATYTKSGEIRSSSTLFRDEVDRTGDHMKRTEEKTETGAKLHLEHEDGTGNGFPAAASRKGMTDVSRAQSVDRTIHSSSKQSSIQGSRVSVQHSDSLPQKNSVFIDQENLNEDFQLPVLVAVGFIFAYIFLGAGMYKLWEEWTYLESFYFVFITTSTIGFGDILPEHPNFFLLSCVYTFLGLALVSMTINVITEWMYKTIDTAKEKVELARGKAMAKAKAATDKLSGVGNKAKNMVLHTVGREGSASPQLKNISSRERVDTADDEHKVHRQAELPKAQDNHATDPRREPAVAHQAGPECPQTGATAGDGGRPHHLETQEKGGSELVTPSSDNETSFRTATDFTASSDSINDQSDKK